MTFLNPIFLWFTGLAALPVIIHFLNRSKLRQVKFSTVRFLIPASKKVLKRFKLIQLLLLILRVLIVLLLTMAFARPVWKGYISDKNEVRNIILIDNSYSMEYRQGKDNALELSKEIAVQLVKELPGQFAIGIINDGLVRLHPFTDNKGELAEEINNVRKSAFTTDLIKSVGEVIKIIDSREDEDAERNIIVLSDFNSDALNGDMNFNDVSNTNILLIDTSDGNNNIWVERTVSNTAYAGISAKIRTVLRANNEVKAKVSLVIDEEKRNQKIVDFSQEHEMDFNYVFNKPGLYEGRIEIESLSENDLIGIDNVNYFQMRVRPRINVLLVDGNPGYTLMGGESYFVTKALSPGNYENPVSVRVINPDELISIKITGFEVILLLNVKMDSGMIRKISDFSAKGGGVGIYLGDNVGYEMYNRMLASLMPVEITSKTPRQINNTYSLRISEKFSRIFSGSSDIKLKKIYETSSGTGEMPDIYAGDEPLLWLYSPGKLRGRSALFTSTSDMDWIDLPLKSAFPAFINELVLYLAGEKENDAPYINVGMAIEDEINNSKDIRIISKDNQTGNSAITDLPVVKIPGNYIIRDGASGKIYSVNLNFSRGESKLSALKYAGLKKVFGEKVIDYIPYSDDMHKEIIKNITGSEKSLLFLVIVFCLLVMEEFLRKYLRKHEE